MTDEPATGATRWVLGGVGTAGALVAALGILWFLQTREWAGLLVVAYGAWLIAAGWTYQDARGRGQPGLAWAVVVFLGHVVGLAVYLVLRAFRSPPGAGTEDV